MTRECAYFQTTFDQAAQDKLYLKRFWTTESPCHWTISKYLQQLVAIDPGVSRRNASIRLLKDAKLVKEYVLVGTLAETMVTSIVSYQKSTRMKNVIRDFFVSQLSTLSKATLEFTTQKSRLRSALVETIASDQEEENANRHSVPSKRQADQASALPDSSRRRPLQPIDETVQPTYDDKDNVWLRWAHFLGDPNNIKQWTHLSPERHKMIWCGPMVRRRSSLPSDLFSSLNENIPMIDKQLIDKNLNPIFLAVCDAVSQREMDDAIDALRVVSAGNDGIKAERKLLVSICDTFNDHVYSNRHVQDAIKKSEACFRSFVFDSCIKATTKFVRDLGHDVVFLPGEVELVSMTKQLSLQGLKDGRLKYLADGVIKVNGDELLLTEVSSGYDNADSSKVSFDHYKAMFGMLAMLKSLSECYHGASFETFSKVKVHFVHGHGTALRHWTLSTPAKGIFVMVKEQKAVVPINDHMKELHLDPFCTFHKTLAMALIDTLSNLKALKNDHKLFLRSPSLTARPNLSTLITPMIIRLNEAKHSAIVADDGPSSAPGSPDNEE